MIINTEEEIPQHSQIAVTNYGRGHYPQRLPSVVLVHGVFVLVHGVFVLVHGVFVLVKGVFVLAQGVFVLVHGDFVLVKGVFVLVHGVLGLRYATLTFKICHNHRYLSQEPSTLSPHLLPVRLANTSNALS